MHLLNGAVQFAQSSNALSGFGLGMANFTGLIALNHKDVKADYVHTGFSTIHAFATIRLVNNALSLYGKTGVPSLQFAAVFLTLGLLRGCAKSNGFTRAEKVLHTAQKYASWVMLAASLVSLGAALYAGQIGFVACTVGLPLTFVAAVLLGGEKVAELLGGENYANSN